MLSKWQALSARIAGIMSATQLSLAGVGADGGDYHGSSQSILVIAAAVVADLRGFRDQYESALSQPARDAVDRAVRQAGRGDLQGFKGVIAVVTALAAFRGEFEYLLSDRTELVRSLVSRALIHLQRTLVVDRNIQAAWRTAFAKHETHLERLGGIHLLQHGVYAFKAHADGQATDLVLGSRLQVDDRLRRAAEGVVLTEWKRVRSVAASIDCATEARYQARRYSTGALQGLALDRRRYLVLVSKVPLELPGDIVEADVTYEHWNLVIEPLVPSVEARRRARQSEPRGTQPRRR